MSKDDPNHYKQAKYAKTCDFPDQEER